MAWTEETKNEISHDEEDKSKATSEKTWLDLGDYTWAALGETTWAAWVTTLYTEFTEETKGTISPTEETKTEISYDEETKGTISWTEQS